MLYQMFLILYWKSPTMFVCIQKHVHLLIIHISATLLFSKCWIKDLISLNSSLKAYSTLIGQMAKSVVIGLLLTVCVGNQISITIFEFQLRKPAQLLHTQ